MIIWDTWANELIGKASENLSLNEQHVLFHVASLKNILVIYKRKNLCLSSKHEHMHSACIRRYNSNRIHAH